ncbi:MAG: adenylosuccinate synthetase, partial [Abditibacteriota bacterium]|nr:adenylosuccinate synthetase [Abditibacteriota bacterium]
MSNVVVVGLQWGDEAKGKVVDYLSQDAEYVVRFNGGNNAGHTVVVGKDTYKFHAIPVGVLNPDAIALITDGVVLDLGVFAEELRGLRERGITASKIKVSGNVHIIMPWHKRLDALEEAYKKDGKVGTTGRGIGPCYADKASRIGFRIYDIIDPEVLPKKLAEVLRLKNDIITKVYGGEPF